MLASSLKEASHSSLRQIYKVSAVNNEIKYRGKKKSHYCQELVPQCVVKINNRNGMHNIVVDIALTYQKICMCKLTL